MASPFKKCSHGNNPNECTMCLAEAMLSIETMGVVHIDPLRTASKDAEEDAGTHL